MIKTLKIRLILVVLLALLLASAGLVLAISGMNMRSVEVQAQEVLSMLAENGGQRPQRLVRQEGESQPPEIPKFDGREFDDKEFDGKNPAERDQRQETPRWPMADPMNAVSLSNYYTITLDENDQVASWSSDRADVYADEEIASLAAAALAQGKETGRVDSQFYRMLDSDGQRQLIVVDARLEFQNARQGIRTTALVALIEDAVLSIGAVFLVHRAVKPVDEAMEKQKQFVWDASHELKTPLAVISANAEVLAQETGNSKPLVYIQSEVRRTDQLIQNLLTLARMEKGTLDIRMEKFDLGRALNEVALPFESAVFETGKRMDIRVPEHVFYTGSEEMIKQLAVILLSNAEKYSDAGGQITVTLESRGDKRVFTVHNTGPAIPREAQEKIFDRFYRVDSSHNREIEGNGLGLAIARNIVNIHRGKIAVSSEEGKGTAFIVTL